MARLFRLEMLHLVELDLRLVPLRHQLGVAGRRADLQARVHGGDQAVVRIRALPRLGPARLQHGVVLVHARLQADQVLAQIVDLLADVGARGRARRYPGALEGAGPEGGRRARLRLGLDGLRLRWRLLGRRFGAGGLLAGQRGQKCLVGKRATS